MRNMRTDECYLQTLSDAKSLAEQCEIAPEFEEKRKKKKRSVFMIKVPWTNHMMI